MRNERIFTWYGNRLKRFFDDRYRVTECMLEFNIPVLFHINKTWDAHVKNYCTKTIYDCAQQTKIWVKC